MDVETLIHSFEAIYKSFDERIWKHFTISSYTSKIFGRTFFYNKKQMKKRSSYTDYGPVKYKNYEIKILFWREQAKIDKEQKESIPETPNVTYSENITSSIFHLVKDKIILFYTRFRALII